MLPGGFDHVLEGPTGAWALDLVLRGLRTVWPKGVLVEAEDTQGLPLQKLAFPFLRLTADVFVYQEAESATFLQLIKRDQDFTIVSDEASRDLAEELLAALRYNRLRA